MFVRKNNRTLSLLRVFFLILITVACQKQDQTPEQILYEKGKAVYMANCISCHNMNPRMQGTVGPDVWGSSIELLEARMLYLKYPEGYTPKRDTGLMPEFLDLKNDIPAIHSFLNK
jgi:mono/diheme cytochrome c family protein